MHNLGRTVREAGLEPSGARRPAERPDRALARLAGRL